MTRVVVRAESSSDVPVERPSFDQVFEDNADFLYNTMRRLGIPEADLPDLVQDTFVVVARILDDYDPERPVRPWLFGIAYRLAARHRALARHHREVQATELPETAADQSPPPDQILADKQARELVLRLLAELTLAHRTVLVLHDIEGMSMKDVTEAVGIPLFTGYSRLRGARKAFRLAVDRARGGVHDPA